MENNINEVVKGFMETLEKLNKIQKYIEIFNKFPEKLKEEFKRTEKYISKEEYNKNLSELNNVNVELLKETINLQIEGFRTLEKKDDISKQYVTFILNELTNYNWDSMTYISKYCMHNLESFERRILKNNDKIYLREDNYSIEYLYQMLKENCMMYLNIIFDKISSIEIFKKVSGIKNNIVMIGANGSGKSTFARTLKGKIDNNITIIPAQHLLVVGNFDSIPINENMIEKVNRYQQKSKLGSDNNIVKLLSEDFEDLIKALLIEKGEASLKYYDTNIKEESILNKTIKIWNELLKHRQIINPTNYTLKVETNNNHIYDFNLLSDGEKAIFYYIAHVLLAKRESYIIVDEPENHINVSICNKLWDRLEFERADCKFIYLTHNVDFAISRNNVTLIWNQEFIPPSTWNFEIIKNNFKLPDKLLIELLGSRSDILFCEGNDKTSYDYKLYTILFPDYTVIPTGGHLNVINYCKAYNSSNQILKNKAIGIIDGDCHEERQIEKWKEDDIYTLEINEIENLLCDDLILQKFTERFMLTNEQIGKFKRIVLGRLDANKQQQSTWYVKTKINNMIKNNFLKEEKDIENLKLELSQICENENIDKIYNDRIEQINSIIADNDYEKAIKIIDNKQKLLDLANKELEKDYPKKVIELIKQDTELQAKIKKKYFKNI